MPANLLSLNPQSKGFTLVELVIGILLFSIAMVVIVSVIMPQTRKGIDPLYQVRAVALAQSVFNEISSKAFDEASITANGREACNNDISCTLSSSLGADSGESRSTYDDIDDFHGLLLDGIDISNASSNTLSVEVSDLFLGFQAQITVVYDDNSDGINDDDLDRDGNLDSGSVSGNQKLITLIVITPSGEELPFAAYRKNV